MIIFVLLNILCFIIILSKCIWADKASWNRTTHNVMAIFSPYHPQLELINLTEDERVEDGLTHECENCEDCEDCEDSNDDSSDNNPLSDSSISTPSVVNTEAEAEADKKIELENPENCSNENSGSESDDSIVVLDTRGVNYLKKAKEIVQGLKDELEKKND